MRRLVRLALSKFIDFLLGMDGAFVYLQPVYIMQSVCCGASICTDGPTFKSNYPQNVRSSSFTSSI